MRISYKVVTVRRNTNTFYVENYKAIMFSIKTVERNRTQDRKQQKTTTTTFGETITYSIELST